MDIKNNDFENIDEITYKMKSFESKIDEYKTSIDNNLKIIETNEYKINILNESKLILEKLKSYKMESKKGFILKIINAALDDVFDQSLRIDIEVSNSNKSSSAKIVTKYDIILYQNDIEISRNEKLLNNNGGGVLSFISILFKMMVGYIYSDNKFFLFDESISQVSSLYRPRMAKFFKEFCNEYGFTLVLISQTDDIDEHANVGYKLGGKFDKNGLTQLYIEDKFGTYPEDNYNYVKIKNFQSIVDLEFRYQGFTVVRGNNNIGKSASFRAINSLLFNTFDVKDFPRKMKKRGVATSIEFGKVVNGTIIVNENISRSISLSYTSGKVIYSFDGLEFAGKSLAFDKIKEKVETIGFKYVNLKETYKNFKGDLKDQTERLAMTTQHDGFYLIGNKNTETDKVFNFLFDTTDVANAILTLNNDLYQLNEQINNATQSNIDLNKKMIIDSLYYDLYVLKYYSININEYIFTLNNNNKIINEINIKQNYVDSVSKYITLENNYNKYLKIIENNHSIDHKIELNIDKHNVILTIIKNINESDIIYKYLELYNSNINLIHNFEILNNKIILFNNIIEKINEIDSYNYYIDKIKDFSNINIINNNIINNININNAKLDIINSILTYVNSVILLKSYNDQYNIIISNIKEYDLITNSYSNKLILINNIIDKVNELIIIQKHINVLTQSLNNFNDYNLLKLNIEENINKMKHTLEHLADDIGLSICSHCNGKGYQDIKE